eukprot:m51a1_g11638 hypothetical protein (145) ;mRNA; r:247-784
MEDREGPAHEPCLLVSSDTVFRTIPFEVALIAGSLWMAQHEVTADDVRTAGRAAELYLYECEDQQRAPFDAAPLPVPADSQQRPAALSPCQLCCAKVSKPNLVLGREMVEMPSEHAGERTFLFLRCQSCALPPALSLSLPFAAC